jgi:hypothetical protein
LRWIAERSTEALDEAERMIKRDLMLGMMPR